MESMPVAAHGVHALGVHGVHGALGVHGVHGALTKHT